MSELKAFNMPRYAGEFTMHEVYLKSEADKVIAELKAQKDAKILALDAETQLRRQKYKRCLAMAERCKYRMYYLAAVVEQEASKIIPLKAQIQWYQKRESRMDYWKNRWLELAEKFKEAK